MENVTLMSKEFKSLRLPEETIRKLQTLKIAYASACGRPMTFEDVVSRLIDCVEREEPAVFSKYAEMLKIQKG